jgi:putative ABC transport system permease protein
MQSACGLQCTGDVDKLIKDLKFGLRSLMRKPGLTVVALLTLALGIGANTALFSILYASLWKPLPYRDANRLAIVWETKPNEGRFDNVANPANYMDWKEQNKTFQDMAAFAQVGSVNVSGVDQPEQVPIQYATPNLFDVLGVRPYLGRTFNNRDGIGEDFTVILSYGLWMRRFGGDRTLPGKQIVVNGKKALVAGVMPEGWTWFIKESSRFGKPPDIWGAFPITPEFRTRHGRYLTVVGRLKPNTSIQQAQSDIARIYKQIQKQFPDFAIGWGTNVVPVREQISGTLRKPLWILAGAVGFVLLIACTNVANVMLARAIARNREMALRTALGADKLRLIRQLLTESVLLSFLGGLIGLALAVWGTQSLALLGQRASIDFQSVQINSFVLLFTILLSIVTGLFFGIVPSIITASGNSHEQLKEGGRSSTEMKTGKLRNILVASQIAIAVILLSAAALLIQSFWKLSSVDPGFDSKNVLTFRLVLARAKYPQDANRIQMFRRIVDTVQSQSGVISAGMTTYIPLASVTDGTSFHIEGRPDPPPGQDRNTNVISADTGYFKTLRIPVKNGRLFQYAEMTERKNVVIINEALAREYFPGENPVGKRITIDMRDENVPSEIVGVVGDVKQKSLDNETAPAVYWPHPELTYNFMTIVVRTAGNPVDFAPTAKTIVQQIDPDQPIAEIRTLNDWIGDSTARSQFNMILLGILSGVALVLAVAGIYGVMSHAVFQRTQEMGIRMALGASRSDVFKLVFKEGSRILIFGAFAGCLATLAITRLMKSMLFETSTTNPAAMASVVVILFLAGMFACWFPSRRASNVSPIEALHYE